MFGAFVGFAAALCISTVQLEACKQRCNSQFVCVCVCASENCVGSMRGNEERGM